MTKRQSKNPITTSGLIILALLGILLLALGSSLYNAESPKLSLIILGLATPLLAVVIIEVIWKFVGGDPKEIQLTKLSEFVTDIDTQSAKIDERIIGLSHSVQNLEDTVDVVEKSRVVGLSEVYDCAGNFGGQGEWLNLLDGANQSVDMMGRTLAGWLSADANFDKLVQRKITDDNVCFRWLIMCEKNRYLDLLEEDGIRLDEQIKHRIPVMSDKLRRIKDELPEDRKDNLLIKKFQKVPLYCSTLRIDDRYLITPYLHSTGSSTCPLIGFSGDKSPWAKIFDREFEEIWRSADEL